MHWRPSWPSRPVGDPALEARLDEAAARIDALAAALAERPQGNPALEARLTETAHRVDAVAAELAGRADAAGQAELSRLVAELAERPDGDPAVAERVQEIHSAPGRGRREAAPDPALAARVEELAAQLEEAAAHAQCRDRGRTRAWTRCSRRWRISPHASTPSVSCLPAKLCRRISSSGLQRRSTSRRA